MKVEYIGHFGDDLMVANAARKSYGSGFEVWSEVPRSERGRSDRELVEGLAKEKHLLPLDTLLSALVVMLQYQWLDN
jgi:hypothetical protein